jgi:hypothetical protein
LLIQIAKKKKTQKLREIEISLAPYMGTKVKVNPPALGVVGQRS